MGSERPIITTEPVDIWSLPDVVPAVMEPNVRAALVHLSGALAALNLGGYEMEHHDGPYGEVFRAAVAVIERAYPEVDGDAVVTDRLNYDEASGRGILSALDAARKG